MRWEYACLVGTKDIKGSAWSWSFIFYRPDGSSISLEGDATVPLINRLGQDGWEVMATEPRYAFFRGDYGYGQPGYAWTNHAEFLVERTIWFKRPINTGASR